MQYAGKVDVNSLVSFTDPDIYFQTPIQGHLTDTLLKPGSLTVEILVEALRKAAFQVLALESWPENITLTSAGASSFDILRLTTQFESYLRTYLGDSKSLDLVSPVDVSKVVDSLFSDILGNLLSKTLTEVAICLFSKLDAVLKERDTSDDHSLSRQKDPESEAVEQTCTVTALAPAEKKSCKRLRGKSGLTIFSKQPKFENDLYKLDSFGNRQANRVLEQMAMDTSSLRGGRIYKNGRYINPSSCIAVVVDGWC